MEKTVILHTKVESIIKEKVDVILNKLGISTTEAINMFLNQVIKYDGLPFETHIPNAETIEAIEEVQEMKRNPSLYKAYTDVDQMMKELLS